MDNSSQSQMNEANGAGDENKEQQQQNNLI